MAAFVCALSVPYWCEEKLKHGALSANVSFCRSGQRMSGHDSIRISSSSAPTSDEPVSQHVSMHEPALHCMSPFILRATYDRVYTIESAISNAGGRCRRCLGTRIVTGSRDSGDPLCSALLLPTASPDQGGKGSFRLVRLEMRTREHKVLDHCRSTVVSPEASHEYMDASSIVGLQRNAPKWLYNT